MPRQKVRQHAIVATRNQSEPTNIIEYRFELTGGNGRNTNRILQLRIIRV